MANRDKEKPVLRRGMAEHDWKPSDSARPIELQPVRRAVPPDFRARPEVATAPKPADRRARYYRLAKIGVASLVAVAAILFIAQASLQGFHAEGVSMEPTLKDGDRIVVNRLAYAQIDLGLLDWAPFIDIHGHWATPSRGDIIVFQSPVEDRELVKRVIGLPGDNVAIWGTDVYVNGKKLDEPYVQGLTTCEEVCSWEVPDGQYFVMGDNREDSRDSREGWFVPLGSIDGKKLFSY